MKRMHTVMVMILLVLLLGACGKTTYTLKLPALEKLSSATLTQGERVRTLSEEADVEAVLSTLAAGRTTRSESIQDAPVGVDTPIRVDFVFREGGVSVLWVYTNEKRGKYFIEQPYNGIYEITVEEYETIAAYLQ